MPDTTDPSIDIEAPVCTRFLLRRENLPRPWVHYPGGWHDGSQCFIAFSEDEQGEPVLCECTQEAVKTAILVYQNAGGTETRNLWLSQSFLNLFPLTFRSLFPKAEMRLDRPDAPDPFWNDVAGWFMHFRFAPALCHRCNLAVPTVRFKKSGGKFDTYFGWYIAQSRFRLGAFKRKEFESRCPPAILEIWSQQDAIDPEWQRLLAAAGAADKQHPDDAQHPERIAAWAAYKPVAREMTRLDREWQKIPENVCRQEFGFAKVGEQWISEGMLYTIVRRVLPRTNDNGIIRHHRPPWLSGLELDIHFPDLKLAFEYNGQQHYNAVPIWGGQVALDAQIENDARKNLLCEQQGITLITIKYTEPLNDQHIYQRIKATPWYQEGFRHLR